MRTKLFATALLLIGLNTSMVWATEVEPDVLQTIEIVSTGIPMGDGCIMRYTNDDRERIVAERVKLLLGTI